MLGVIVFYLILSPLLPMIYLFVRYFERGADRIIVSLMMLGVCAASLLLGNLYQEHARGLDGMRALGAIWGGFAGIIISLVMLLAAVIGAMM